jgi:Arc/MetJ family transcription regulator
MVEATDMDRSIEIPDELVKAAQEMTGQTDEREAVETMLRRALGASSKPAKNMFDLVGKVRLREDYDYKALRADRHDPD